MSESRTTVWTEAVSPTSATTLRKANLFDRMTPLSDWLLCCFIAPLDKGKRLFARGQLILINEYGLVRRRNERIIFVGEFWNDLLPPIL